MADDRDRSGSLSGLTEAEAAEFHSIFVKSFIAFVAVAAVAHFLVWSWRPWIGARADLTGGDALQSLASLITNLV